MSFDPDAIRAAPAVARGPHPLALLGQIWFRPGQALRNVVNGPGWLWLLPMVLAIALMLARVFAAAPVETAARAAELQAAHEAQLQEMPAEYRESLPPEELQAPAPAAALILGPPLLTGLGGILLGWLVRAALLHVSSLALGGRQGFGPLYRASAWASFPLILRDAVQAAYVLITHELIRGPGLSGLLLAAGDGQMQGVGGQPQGIVPTIAGVVLGRIDLYTLWYLGLLIAAVVAAGRLPRGKAIAVVAIYTLLSLAAGLGGTLLQGVASGL